MNKRYYSLATEGKTADVMIYGDVTSWPWLESDVSSYNLAREIKGLDVDVINVGINSYGGEVAEGLAIYNALRNHPAKVVTHVNGFACSVASVIFAAGDERVMDDASLLMIHNAWTCASGSAADMRKAADDLDTITEASIRAYMNVLNVSEDELRQMMDDETWIEPEKAVEMGFATSVNVEKTDKPAQNARKKVQMRILNPYMADDEKKNDDDNKNTAGNGTEGDSQADNGENGGTGTSDDEKTPKNANPGANTDDDPDVKPDDDPDDDEDERNGAGEKPDDDEEDAQMGAFFRAIMAM